MIDDRLDRLAVAKRIITDHFGTTEKAPVGLMRAIYQALGAAELRGFDECFFLLTGAHPAEPDEVARPFGPRTPQPSDD